jgi:hypothetical protein
MQTDITNVDEQQLRERQAALLNMLRQEEIAQEAPVALGPVAEPVLKAVPQPQNVLDLRDEDVVETVLLENRIGMATNFPQISTAFVMQADLPEYQRIMQEYQDAVAETMNADTQSIQCVLQADEVRRSLSVFNSKIQASENEVGTARRQLEAAQRQLANAESKANAIKCEYMAAQTNVVETVRRSEEAVARADSSAFKAIRLVNMANRYLLDQEIDAVGIAFDQAVRRAEGLCGIFSTIEEVEDTKSRLKVPFAFKMAATQVEETEQCAA